MTRIGRYEVVEEIGRGGMGAVYEARDPELERRVAIKLLYAHHAGLVREEARALAALNHPGIVTIHEIGEHEGRPYLVMELLRGRALRELLHTEARPTRDRLVEICAAVARAIAEAHERGVLHRDIKPENAVVLDGGGVKVVDFGIARRLEGEHVADVPPDAAGGRAAAPVQTRATRIVSAFACTMPFGITPDPNAAPTQATAASLPGTTQTVFGTPAYMAPEVLSGGPSTPASDVYSLGVLLYECLAGRRPFEAPQLVNVVAMVLDGAEPEPLTDPLAPLVARMMTREPALRPSAAEVVLALAPRAPRPRRARAGLAVTGAITLAGAAAIAWHLTRHQETAAASAASPSPVHSPGPLAIGAINPVFETYGDPPGKLGEIFAIVLGGIDGMRVLVQPSQLPDAAAAETTARSLGASYLVRGKLVEDHGIVTGDLEIVDLATHRIQPVTARRPIAETSALVMQLADGVASELAPGAHLEATAREALGRRFAELGTAELAQQHWNVARAYLEQAVEIDPKPWQTWEALAEARGWNLAPQPWIDDAIKRALATSPPGPHHAVTEGAAHYLQQDLTGAITVLEPLLPTLSGDDATDATYYLGESLWHRGDHARGAELLQRVLDARRTFTPAGLHVMQYAIVRRDLARAAILIGLLNRPRQSYEFLAGNYAAVAASGEFPYDFQAQLVLGKSPSPELEAKLGDGLEGHTYRMARALAAGDHTTAAREFADTWKQYIAGRPATDTLLYAVTTFADVVAVSGMPDETRQLIGFLRSSESPRFSTLYRHVATLAAPTLGTPPPAETTTPREQRLHAAIAAELAGKRTLAVQLLAELIADPGENWEYGERIALLRNLASLGDRKALAAQCAELAHPPVFRYEWLIARRACP